MSAPSAPFSGTSLPTWWDFIEIAPEERPSLDTKDKGKEYDLACSRHYLGRTRAIYMNFMRMCTAINEGFASGILWGLQPDIQSYLMDKGSTSSRQPFQFNLFTPILARQLGLLAQIDVYARAESATQKATSRREMYIMRAQALASGAAAGGDNVRGASMAMGIPPDPYKAKIQAEQSFQDPVIEGINSIVTLTAIDCDVEMIRKQVGQAISNSGLGAVHCYFNGPKMVLDALGPSEVVYDINARRPDMADAEFVAVCKLKSIQDLMELYPNSKQTLIDLETSVRQGRADGNTLASWPQDMPRPFVTYYKDGDWVERGFIEGPNGPEMVTIGEIDPDTQKPRYTEADLIDPPSNFETKDWKGRTDRRFVVKGRYCVFIPREYCPSVKKENGETSKPDDLILAYGECDLIETDPMRTNSIKYPVKMGTWMNIGGFVVSPLTAAQSPQRVMNIVSSDIVDRLSKATGRSVVFGKRALAGGNTTVSKAAKNLKDGDPIQIDEAVSGSVGNAIGMAGEGLDPNIFKEFDLLEQLKGIMESVTQLYDQNFGAQGSANELVGVKRLQWQQASVAQHPYHEAVRLILKQVYEWIANTGRKHILRYPSVLEDMVGEKAAKALLAMRDLDTEQVRVQVVLAPNAEQVKQATTEMVLQQLFPMQLIGAEDVGELLGNAYPEQAYAASARFTKDRAMAQQQQAQEQERAAAIGALDQREAQLVQNENDLYNKMLDIGVKSDATNSKAETPMRAALADHMKPQQAA